MFLASLFPFQQIPIMVPQKDLLKEKIECNPSTLFLLQVNLIVKNKKQLSTILI